MSTFSIASPLRARNTRKRVARMIKSGTRISVRPPLDLDAGLDLYCSKHKVTRTQAVCKALTLLIPPEILKAGHRSVLRASKKSDLAKLAGKLPRK